MNKVRRLSDEQIAEIVQLRERGRSYDQLAQQFGVSRGAVLYQCLKAGAAAPRQRRAPIRTEPMSFVARDGRTQRRFTQDEDDRLVALRKDGRTIPEIAREIGRANTSVRIRLLTIALHEELAA